MPILGGGYGFLGGIFGKNKTPYQTYAAKNEGVLDEFAARNDGVFQGQIDRGTAGANQYADAVGVNGQAGYDRAGGAFQASPGYQFSVDEATRAAGRAASAAGMLPSGNYIDAATRVGQGLADQEYQRYLGNLFPFLDAENRGLENKVGLDTLTTTARLDSNTAMADADQQRINARKNVLGNILGFGARILGAAL